jgi:hypothetical protein
MKKNGNKKKKNSLIVSGFFVVRQESLETGIGMNFVNVCVEVVSSEFQKVFFFAFVFFFPRLL